MPNFSEGKRLATPFAYRCLCWHLDHGWVSWSWYGLLIQILFWLTVVFQALPPTKHQKTSQGYLLFCFHLVFCMGIQSTNSTLSSQILVNQHGIKCLQSPITDFWPIQLKSGTSNLFSPPILPWLTEDEDHLPSTPTTQLMVEKVKKAPC